MKALQSDDSGDAALAFQVAQMRMNQQDKRTGRVGFSEQESTELTSKHGARAADVLKLSNAVRDGEISQADAMAQAMKDPQLMAAAAAMLSAGDVAFS